MLTGDTRAYPKPADMHSIAQTQAFVKLKVTGRMETSSLQRFLYVSPKNAVLGQKREPLLARVFFTNINERAVFGFN